LFKRRSKRTFAQRFAEGVYPRGGWARAGSYVLHRLRRLPDPPHKIARGVAVGVFVCFTPFYGFHFIIAAILTFILQGNYLAALFATFFGNPITFPIIATISIELGFWMMGLHGGIPLPEIIGSFTNASLQLWHNFTAIFTPEVAHWDLLVRFFWRVFWPYLIGGIIPGIITATVFYLITLPLISAYQKRRIKKLKKRYEKKILATAAKAEQAVAKD